METKYMDQPNQIPASTPVQKTASTREIAERILGQIDWLDTSEGYCQCPGAGAHSTRKGARDCKVFLDKIPTIHCVHASCGSAVKAINRKLRNAVLNGTDEGPHRLTEEEKEKIAERQERERIRLRAMSALPQLLKTHRWIYDDICTASPVRLPDNAAEHWQLLLEQFKPQDIVWIGNMFHSGKEEHSRHFRTATEWRNESAAPGPFVCPATFKNNSFARSNDNVLDRRFLVVESDVLNKDQVGAVFGWLQKEAGLELAAIVDTAGKSLHAWFRFPPEDQLDHLRTVLPAFGCDPKLFTASQPVRLPGALRGEKFQKLIYLSKGGAA